MKKCFSILIIGQLLISTLSWGRSDSVNFFPANYEESRMLFRKKSLEIKKNWGNVEISHFSVPSKIDPDLTVDFLYIPATEKQEKLIILTSGVHGPEAYTGAALQFLFLDEYLNRTDLRSTGLLVIHSVNPYGFKYHRRGTENNVNLNRNFDTTSKLFLNQNKGYSKLISLLEPQDKVGIPAFEFLENSMKLINRLATGISMDSLNEAIGEGQYSNPRGLEFGGSNFEPQVIYLESVLKHYIGQYNKTLAIDLHTGLGESGKLHLMTGDNVSRDITAKVEKLFRGGSNLGFYQLTNGDSKGFYHVHGDFIDFVAKLNPNQNNIIALTAEFGTVGNGLLGKLQTVNRLILENQGHHFGYSNIQVEKRVKKEFLELFYPQEIRWKFEVLFQFRALLDRAILF